MTITPSGGAATVIPFTLLEKSSTPYKCQLVIDHGASASPRYLLHTVHADTGTANSFGGRVVSDQYSIFGWGAWTSGTFSASR